MNVLGIDVGSSSVKAGIIRKGKVVGTIARASYATNYTRDCAEASATQILHAVGRAIAQLGARAKRADVIVPSVMGPSWVAMDHDGRAITPVVTHQDRRSVEESQRLIKTFGKSQLLKRVGNLPFPGGISSTTWAWFNRHERGVMRKADLVGHFQTYLHRQLNGARVIDPSHASFTGLYDVVGQRGWNESVCNEVGATEHQLPQLIESEGMAGMVTRAAGEKFGLTHGTPMLVGCLDTSAAMLLAGAKPGQLLNVSGSTDVLALCTNRPKPHERLLTRALGMGKLWMSVSTLAAAGSSLSWAKDQLLCDISETAFFKLVDELSRDSNEARGGVTFEPYLAGERTSIEQRSGVFSGLSLSTTRRQMLAAIIESLARASAERLDLLKTNSTKMSKRVVVSGGVRGSLHKLLHRDWRGSWTFKVEEEATLRGLAVLADD